MPNLATPTAKGPVTISWDMRQRLGFRPKDRRLVVVQGKAAVLIPHRVRPLTAFFVVLPAASPFPEPHESREKRDDAPRCHVAAGEE